MTDSMMDRELFKAIVAGDSSLPDVGDYVYYFPKGHADSTFSAAGLFSDQIKQSHALCLITNVKYLADEHSDELYAKFTLVPNPSPRLALMSNSIRECANRFKRVNPIPFAKILTRSDATNGGGFSVPKFCADTVYPPLDDSLTPPKQILEMEDMQGKKWSFRHVYRGSPLRHLLTTQWSKFCDAKLLCKDDTVVFVNREGKLYIGIRRARANLNAEGGTEKLGVAEVSNRGVRFGKVKEEEVVEAVKAMEKGESFEVSYYPRVGGVKCIIGKEVVEDSLRVEWKKGMRISMDVQKMVTGEVVCFKGRVVDVLISTSASYWKTIQVSFDEPSALHHVKSTAVSPWEIKPIPTLQHVKSTAVSPWEINPIPTTKRPRSEFDFLAQDIKTLACNPYTYLNYFPTVFPACMQGARQTCTYASFLSTSKAEPNTTMSNLTTQNNSSDQFPAAAVVPGKKTRRVVKLFGEVISRGDHTEDMESSSSAPSVSGTRDVVASDAPFPFREFL